MAVATVESPCISVCAMKDDTGFCIGCYRTLEEIRGWWDLDNAAKNKVVEATLERQQAAFD